jgi:MFS family permease
VSGEARRRRRAVSVAFLAFGIAAGSLIPRLPSLKDHMHLTDGQVGIALLGIAAGGVTGSLVSRLAVRRDARKFVRIGTVALCVSLIGPGLAQNLGQLMVALYVMGVMCGFLDVLENAQGADLEVREGRPLINGFHGFWSMGALAGSLVAGVAAYTGVAPLPQFAVTGALVVVGSAWFLGELPDLLATQRGGGAAAGGAQGLAMAVLAIAVITFAGIIAEGGTSDWSAIFLRELSHANPGIAAVGFSGFAFAAMLVRFRADLLTARTSRATVARLGAVTAVAGLLLAIALPALPTAIAGFALVGMGTAVLMPIAFAAGANLGQSGTALALVMASAYAGTIAGPPLIGAAADHVGLRVAMAIPLMAILVVLALAGSLGTRSFGRSDEAMGEARRKEPSATSMRK